MTTRILVPMIVPQLPRGRNGASIVRSGIALAVIMPARFRNLSIARREERQWLA
jgi:hypothetical protein